MIQGRGFSLTNLSESVIVFNPQDPTNPQVVTEVMRVPSEVLDDTPGNTKTPLGIEWPLSDRSYPSTMANDVTQRAEADIAGFDDHRSRFDLG